MLCRSSQIFSSSAGLALAPTRFYSRSVCESLCLSRRSTSAVITPVAGFNNDTRITLSTRHRIHSAASSQADSVLTFDNILSESNLQRCRETLKKQKPIEPKNLPWLRGRDVDKMITAAVLIPFCFVDGQPSVLLTLRSPHLPTHKGEVSFPGGKFSAGDRGLTDTALREYEEEIGLERKDVEVLGQMLPLPGRDYEMLVTPILGFCGNIDLSKLKVNQSEVWDVFAASLASLCSTDNARYTTFKTKVNLSMPVFIGQKHRIWGLTAFLLHNSLKLIAPGLYGLEVPVPTKTKTKDWQKISL